MGGGIGLLRHRLSRLIAAGLCRVDSLRLRLPVLLVNKSRNGNLVKFRVSHKLCPVGKSQLHGFRQQVEILRRFRIHGSHVIILQNIQHLQDDGTAGGRQCGGVDIISPVGAMHRLGDVDVVIREVLRRQISAVLLHGIHNLLRDLPAVEGFLSLFCNELQRVRQVGIGDGIARFIGHLPVRIQVNVCGTRICGYLRIGVLDVTAGDLRDGKPVSRHVNGGLHHLLPAHGTIVVQGVQHSLYFSGNSHGLCADLILLILYGSVLQDGPLVKGSRLSCPVPEVDKYHFPGLPEPDRHKASAADTGRLLLADTEGKPDGAGGVDGIAPCFHDIHSDPGRIFSARGDDAVCSFRIPAAGDNRLTAEGCPGFRLTLRPGLCFRRSLFLR